MFDEITDINTRPRPWEVYTAGDLWTDEHTSAQMLACHLNDDIDLSSRNARFIDRSVEWIVSRFDIGAGTKIADFGCGPGLYTTRLARTHADVTGIDFSPRSIEYARKVASDEGLSIEYVNRNYLDFETDDRYQLILMIMCDFCALSPAQRHAMLTRFHSFLEPRGSVLLDAYSLIAFAERKEVTTYDRNLFDGFFSPNEYFGFLNTFKYEEENVIVDKYTLVEASRIRTIYNWLQYFSPEGLEREFTACGFEVQGLYSDVAGSPFDPESPEMAIVATKPSAG